MFNCHLSFLRPQNTLVFLGDRTESFVDELLDALAAIGFPCVDISFRIGGDAMHAVEFAGLAPTFTECSQDLKGLAIENMHAIILAVGEDDRVHILDRESRSEEHTSELQSLAYLVCRLLLEKKN